MDFYSILALRYCVRTKWKLLIKVNTSEISVCFVVQRIVEWEAQSGWTDDDEIWNLNNKLWLCSNSNNKSESQSQIVGVRA